MTVKSGQVWGDIVVALGTAGGTATLSGGTAILYIDGTANAAAVTLGTIYPYVWSVTLPTLTAGQSVSMYVAGTVDSTYTASVVRQDMADTYLTSDIESLVDDVESRIGTPSNLGSGATLAGNLVDIESQTDDIGVAGAGLTGVTATVAISAAAAATVSTGALALRTYHTFSQAITSTSTAALNTATKLWLAIKREHEDADSASIAFIEATAGLTYLAGAAYAGTANGTLAVTGSSGAWIITAGLQEAATAALGAYVGEALVAECKALVSSDTVDVWDGSAAISGGIVRAYS